MKRSPDKVYAVEVKLRGRWQLMGSRMYGIDLGTDLVGPYYVSSLELASRMISDYFPFGREHPVRVVEYERKKEITISDEQ